MKRFFQRVWIFLQGVFGGFKKFEQFLTDHVDDAIDIAGKIKAIVDSPATILIIKLLPEKYRTNIEKALAKIEPILDKTVEILNIGGDCLSKTTTLEKITCFVEQLRKRSPKEQEGIIRQFASTYAQVSSGFKYRDSMVNAAVENRYLDKKFDLEKKTTHA